MSAAPQPLPIIQRDQAMAALKYVLRCRAAKPPDLRPHVELLREIASPYDVARLAVGFAFYLSPEAYDALDRQPRP